MKEFKGINGQFSIGDIEGGDIELHADLDGDKSGIWVATIVGCQTTITETKAHAKLFCASKQMLEALQEIMDHWQNAADWGPSDKLIDKAEAALSAALD